MLFTSQPHESQSWHSCLPVRLASGEKFALRTGCFAEELENLN